MTANELGAAVCTECNQAVMERPTTYEYQGEEIFLFDPVVCVDCLARLCEQYSTECVNCGGVIPPFSQVGVLKADADNLELVHMTTRCTSVGSAFHGYWGKGQLRNFVQVEAC